MFDTDSLVFYPLLIIMAFQKIVSLTALRASLELLTNNAKSYNPSKNAVHKMAIKLQSYIRKQLEVCLVLSYLPCTALYKKRLFSCCGCLISHLKAMFTFVYIFHRLLKGLR